MTVEEESNPKNNNKKEYEHSGRVDSSKYEDEKYV
jgi:hypothetical protein